MISEAYARAELQGRIEALDATMQQLANEGVAEDLLWEAFELFADLPGTAFASETDRAWWDEQLCAALEKYGLASLR